MNPVFAYEWITSTRRWQSYAARSCFVAALLGGLFADRCQQASARPRPLGARWRRPRLAELFFLALSGTQLAVVLLAAPAATAGAICVDRARGTLMHMLVTDLGAVEIVLGKLAARLTPVLLMLACTFPVLEILSLLGSVDPNALLGAFAVTVGVAVLACSLAMTFSLWVGKTHQALLGTYAVLFLWLLAAPMLGLLASSTGWPWLAPPSTSEPFFLALAAYWSPGSVGWGDYLLFLGVTGSISAVLAGVATLRIRAVCTRGSVPKAQRSSSSSHGGSIWRLMNKTVPWLAPSLDGNPVVWREWRRRRPSRWMMAITMAYAGLSILFSVVSIWASSAFRMRDREDGVQVSVGLLLLGVRAATSLAEEHSSGSLDLMLSTPLSTRQIVFGKWLGTFRE